MQTVVAIAGVVVTWIALAALLIGNGLLVTRPLRALSSAGDRAWSALWAGFVLVLAFLQVWHLFLPVGGAALAVVAATGAAGLGLERRAIVEAATGAGRKAGALAVIVVVSWLADRALGPPIGDSLLYHLHAIRWIGAHRAVPGLANLDYRLGFNNASLLWSSLVDVGPWEGRGSHIAVGVLVTAWVLRSSGGILRWTRGTATRADVFAAFVLTPMIAHAITLGELRISTSDPDTFCGLLVLAAIERFSYATASEQPGSTPRARDVTLILSVALAAASGAVKAVALPFAAALAVACVLHVRRTGSPGTALRVAARAGAVLAIVFVPWTARGVVLSGHPLFPSSLLPLPFDWTVRPELAPYVRSLIQLHYMPPVAEQMAARLGSPTLGWLWWQLTRCPELVLLPAGLVVAALTLIRRRQRALDRSTWLVILALLPALGVWAWQAPAPRFAYALFWAAAGTLAAEIADLARGRAHPAALLAVGLALLPPLHRTAAWALARQPGRVVETWVITRGPQPPEPSTLIAVAVGGGLSVHVPASGPMGDAPLLSTQELFPGLEARSLGDLGAGFRIR